MSKDQKQQAAASKQAAGVPLDREEDHPHVYWSVPKDWVPTLRNRLGIGLDPLLVARLIGRLPASSLRDQILGRIGGATSLNPQPSSVADDILATLETCAQKQLSTAMTYFSAARDVEESRVISIARIEYGAPGRVLAHCHRAHTLKWFRLDRIRSASQSTKPFEACDEAVVQQFVDESLDGFHAPEGAQTCVFFVRYPEARFIRDNLPQGGRAITQSSDQGVTVTIKTAALTVLARFVAGLGEAARVIDPEDLREQLLELAFGSLKSNASSVRLATRLAGLVKSVAKA